MSDKPEPQPSGERIPPPDLPRTAVGAFGVPRSIALFLTDKEEEERVAKAFSALGWKVVTVKGEHDVLEVAVRIVPRLFLTDSLSALFKLRAASGALPHIKRLCWVDRLIVSSSAAWEAGAEMVVHATGDIDDVLSYRVVKKPTR